MFNGPFPSTPQTGATQIRVGVYIDGSDGLNAYDITLLTNAATLKPAGIDLAGTVLNSGVGPATVVLECLGGNLVAGTVCSSTDTAGTIHLAASAAPGAPLTTAPTSGILFTAIFNITATTSSGGIAVGFQSGCSQTSVAGGVCVTIANGSTTPDAETVQAATFDNSGGNSALEYYTIVANITSTTTQVGSLSGRSVLITVNAPNGLPLFGSTFVTLSTAVSAGFTAPNFGGNPTFTCSVFDASNNCTTVMTLSTATAGTYSVTVYGTYVADNCGPTGPCSGATYTLVGTLTIRVNVQSVAWTINGVVATSAQTNYYAKGVQSIVEVFTSQGGYSGSVTVAQSACVPGTTGVVCPLALPPTFPLASGQTVTKLINFTATAFGQLSYRNTMTATGLSVVTSGTDSIRISEYTMVSNSTSVTFNPGGSGGVLVTLTSFGAASQQFTGAVTIGSTVTPSTGLIISCNPGSVVVPAGLSTTTTCTLSSSTPNTYLVRITGVGGTNNLMTNQTAQISVVVASPGGINLSASPTSVTAPLGPTGGTSTITVASRGGFSNTVTLSATATGGSSCNLSVTSIPMPAGGTSILTCSSNTAQIASETVTATATGANNSTSVSFTFTVRQTSTTVNCSPASVPDNQASTCTVTVADISSGTTVTPTGTVSFTTNSTGTFSSTSCTLASGTCSVTYTPTVVGHALITGTYSPDAAHSGSSGTFNLASTKRNTTTTVSCSPASVPDNQPSTCTVTVADSSGAGAITPTGTVSFATNSTGTFSATTCTLSSGSCSVTYTPTVVGHALITGTYAGDSVHNGSSGTFNLASTKRTTTTTVTCSPASVLDNVATTCTVTVADSNGAGGITPTGTVSFTSNSTGTFSATSCTLASGTCSVTYTPTVVGHALITGTYAGDNVHTGSSGTFTIASTIRASSTSVTCSPASVLDNTPSTCTVTVSDASGVGAVTPTGTVSFTTNSTGTFSATTCTLSGGSCSVTYTPTVVGHALITGTYGGDSVHTGSSGTFTLASTKRTTTTTVSCSPASVVNGNPTSCTATVADSSGAGAITPTGTVTFTTNSTGSFSSTTCTLVSGSCSVTYTPNVVGHHLITGTYAGDSVHTGSSGTFNLASTLRASATSVSCSPASVLDNTPSTCAVTVTDASGAGGTTPTGTVSFTSNSTGTFSATSCTLASGTCSVTYTPTVVGHALITGTYPGDSVHTGSSGTFTLALFTRERP